MSLWMYLKCTLTAGQRSHQDSARLVWDHSGSEVSPCFLGQYFWSHTSDSLTKGHVFSIFMKGWTVIVDTGGCSRCSVKEIHQVDICLPTGSTLLACPSRYETKARGEPGTGTMWVQYANGFLSPLVADFTTSGYAGYEGYDNQTFSPCRNFQAGD